MACQVTGHFYLWLFQLNITLKVAFAIFLILQSLETRVQPDESLSFTFFPTKKRYLFGKKSPEPVERLFKFLPYARYFPQTKPPYSRI